MCRWKFRISNRELKRPLLQDLLDLRHQVHLKQRIETIFLDLNLGHGCVDNMHLKQRIETWVGRKVECGTEWGQHLKQRIETTAKWC